LLTNVVRAGTSTIVNEEANPFYRRDLAIVKHAVKKAKANGRQPVIEAEYTVVRPTTVDQAALPLVRENRQP